MVMFWLILSQLSSKTVWFIDEGLGTIDTISLISLLASRIPYICTASCLTGAGACGRIGNLLNQQCVLRYGMLNMMVGRLSAPLLEWSGSADGRG